MSAPCLIGWAQSGPRKVLSIAIGGLSPPSTAERAAATARELVKQLGARGHSVGLIIVDTVSPPPVEQLRHALASVPAAMTVEAHYLVGGLGSLVSEIVAEHGLRCRVARVAAERQSHRGAARPPAAGEGPRRREPDGDGREPLRASAGEAFLLPPVTLGSGAHRGRNLASGETRLFLIDDHPDTRA